MPLHRADDSYEPKKFDAVLFPMTDGNVRIIYRVTYEALRDRASADGSGETQDFVETFLKHRPRIEQIANEKYDAGVADRVVTTAELTPPPNVLPPGRGMPQSMMGWSANDDSTNQAVIDAARRRGHATAAMSGPTNPPFSATSPTAAYPANGQPTPTPQLSISSAWRDSAERAEILARVLAATVNQEIERLKSERLNDPDRQAFIDFLELLSATLDQIATAIGEARQAVTPQDREQKFAKVETLASSLTKAWVSFAERNYERIVDYGGYSVITLLGTGFFANLLGVPYDLALTTQLALLGITSLKTK